MPHDLSQIQKKISYRDRLEILHERPVNLLPQPILQTPRLILRPFTLADAPDVMNYAGAREVAATTLNIPHPYEPGMAEQWISAHAEQLKSDKTVNYAIILRPENRAIGGIGFHAIALEHQRAEMGYCIGVAWWGQGYCTEAAQAMLAYGFETLGLNRIFAQHFSSNPASGRVMQKIGMRHEGHFRQHVIKWGQPMDDEVYGILKEDYLAAKA